MKKLSVRVANRSVLVVALALLLALQFAGAAQAPKGKCPLRLDEAKVEAQALENARDSELMGIMQSQTGRKADDAYAEIWQRHYDRIVTLLVKRTPTRQDAEDIAQVAFSRAWTARNSFKLGTSFSAWINQIAINRATDVWRGRNARRKVDAPLYAVQSEDHGPVLPDIVDPKAPPEVEAPDFTDGPLDAKLLSLLGRRERQLVLLRQQGATYKQIMEKLGISENAVGVALSQARKKINDYLNNRPKKRNLSIETAEHAYYMFFVSSISNSGGKFFEAKNREVRMDDVKIVMGFPELRGLLFMRVIVNHENIEQVAKETGHSVEQLKTELEQTSEDLKTKLGDRNSFFMPRLDRFKNYFERLIHDRYRTQSRKFTKAWAQLEAQRREVYQHVMFEGKSVEETAEIMKLNPTVIQEDLSKARADLTVANGENVEALLWLSPEFKKDCTDFVGVDAPLAPNGKAILALAKLSQSARDIFYRVELKGQSVEDVASELHLSVQTVQSTLNRATYQLKEELKDDYDKIVTD